MENENQRPITDKQVKFLKDLAESRAMEDADRQMLLEHMGTFDTKLASKWIDALKRLPPKAKPSSGRWLIPADIPDGRYAVRNSSKIWVFFRIITKEDRKNGLQYRAVQKVLGSPGDFRYVRVTADEWNLAVAEIRKDPGLASTLFGIQTGTCGICGSPLTDPESIAMGIGPICAKKYGFDDLVEDEDDEDLS